MSKSYHEQFRDNQREKNQNGLFSKSKATAGNKLPAQRSTAVVKQPLRSDTFTLPTKRNETNFKVPKINQLQNGSRRQTIKEPAVINSSPPAEQIRTEIMRKNGANRTTLRQPNPIGDRQNLERKPVRFANNHNNTYYSSSPASPPVYYEKTAPLADPLPRDTLDKSRNMRVINDDYVIHRRKDPPAYAYNDYQTVSDIPTLSYVTSLPPITQSTNPTAPTVIIHSKEKHHSDSSTIIPTISTVPSYRHTVPTLFYPTSTDPTYPSTSGMIFPSSFAPTYPSTSEMIFPSSFASTYPSTSTMILPSSTVPTYPSTSTMILPTTTAPTYPSTSMFLPTSTVPSYYPNSTMYLPTTGASVQPPVHTVVLPPPSTSSYASQPYFYPISYPNPPVSAAPAPPPPPPQQTIINQSSASAAATSAPVKTEENKSTIIVRPNTTTNSKNNVTIQLKMLDEDIVLDKTRPQRVVRVVRDPPYREVDDVYYVQPEPKRVIYEQPTRRTSIIRKPRSATQYVYMDNSPSTIMRPRPHRSEVVYIDNNRPLEFEEEIVYVDDNGNEIEYIYDNEPNYHRRNYKKSRHPSLTNIVYQ